MINPSPPDVLTEDDSNDGRPLITPDTTDLQEGDTELQILAKIATLLTP